MRKDCVFFCQIPVRHNEVNSQGVVYGGNYTIYSDFTIVEFFRSKGYTLKQLVSELDSEVCQRKATVEFFAPVFEGDMLDIGVRIARIGNKSFTIVYEIYRQNENEMLVSAEVIYVGYDSVNRLSRPISDVMKEILSS